jgi:hypothetical protein
VQPVTGPVVLALYFLYDFLFVIICYILPATGSLPRYVNPNYVISLCASIERYSCDCVHTGE